MFYCNVYNIAKIEPLWFGYTPALSEAFKTEREAVARLEALYEDYGSDDPNAFRWSDRIGHVQPFEAKAWWQARCVACGSGTGTQALDSLCASCVTSMANVE